MGFGLGERGIILSVFSYDLGPYWGKQGEVIQLHLRISQENARVTNPTTKAFMQIRIEYEALF